MRCRAVMLLGVSLVVAACKPDPSATDTPTDDAGSAQVDESGADADADSDASADELAVESFTLPASFTPGWQTIPAPPKARAVANYRYGLKLLEVEGKPEDALEALDEALADDPSYAWARFGRARTLAALGREQEALHELLALLQADLPSFRPALLQDEQLESLRTGAHREQLEALVAKLEFAYADVIARGVPAWIYTPRSANNPRTKSAQAPWEDLRLGVLDPLSGRFVPLSPSHPLALGGLLDRAAARMLIVSGEIIDGDMHVMQARDVGVHLYDLGKLGTAIIDQRRIDDRHAPTRHMRRALAAAIDPTAKPTGNNEGKSEHERARVRLTYYDLGYEPLVISERVAPGFLKILDRDPAEHIGPARTHLLIDRISVGVHEPLDAVTLSGGRLEIDGRPGSIALPRAHAKLQADRVRVQRSADGRYLMVFSQRARCGGNGRSLEHALTRVDLDSGEATLLAREQGLANAELSAEGWVYYGTGETAVRYAPNSVEAQSDLPGRVYLTLPTFPSGCGA